MVNTDSSTILVGKGPPTRNKMRSNSIWGGKGDIYFGFGPPQKILLKDNKQIIANTDTGQADKSTASTPNEKGDSKNSRIKLAQKARLIGKLVTAVTPNNEQNKQICANWWGYTCSDNESEEGSARLHSNANSETFTLPNPSDCRFFMSRNRKYNEIVTSHTQIAQTLANIDKDIDVYRQTCDYKFDAMSYCTNYGLESPFINEFQGGFINDHKARTPSSLWIEYLRLGNSSDI